MGHLYVVSHPDHRSFGAYVMRTGRLFVVACAAAASLPLGIGAIVVTAIATTLAGAIPSATLPVCAPNAPGGIAATIDRWIEQTVPTSPLVGTGRTMVSGAAGTGLDPRLLAAIALQETRLGTAGGGPAVFNPFGLGPGLVFSSWAGAIALAVGTLVTMHMAGAQTIAGISVHWAPIGAANDPGGLNANWTGGVSRAYAQLGGNPSGPVFGPASSRRASGQPRCPVTRGRTA